MRKEIIYKYLGTNGVIESPVHLEDIYYVRSVRLYADPGKKLYNGEVYRSVIKIPEDEVGNWVEVLDPDK